MKHENRDDHEQQSNLDEAMAKMKGETMTNKEKETLLNDAIAFWKDAVRQYRKAINDPTSSEQDRRESLSYYLRASENLSKAWTK